MLRYPSLLLAGLIFAGFANADVTLYQVSASHADPDAPTVSIDISYIVSAVGTAEDGSATTYVAEEVMSREQAIYSTKTATLVSEPTTFTRKCSRLHPFLTSLCCVANFVTPRDLHPGRIHLRARVHRTRGDDDAIRRERPANSDIDAH
ncbi:uncharacterized protein SCHCODRAFT_02215225 [Schizophyllum commune H4-8]|uniref:uncharacterized protein n=1 Tax=Schizophyllum commune (strain H4-8 / FGSC 9210) TaxID=578458 RepID=UPI00215E29D8|nr:uncharacterized protein SCHCODRAFT_02215225 [Schizophyllum commune H4-8]KAI5894740.1 hypothetical protein SCHCODRAFT_02215225 [Schizophyllum commune H4-8]